jgi:RNA polymerase sigma-70 factor, ECF subfamily
VFKNFAIYPIPAPYPKYQPHQPPRTLQPTPPWCRMGHRAETQPPRPVSKTIESRHRAVRLSRLGMPDPVTGRGFGQEGSQEPSALTRQPLRVTRVPEWGEPERPSVSDWASALSWGGNETQLVSELQAGSETAFDWLVTHYHGPVYNLILSMLGDASDAADGTQEVFLKAFRGIRGFRQGSSLKTWLYRIAIREALNHKRWFKRHSQKNVSIDAEPEKGHATIEIQDLGATPFEQLAAHEIQAAVQQALQDVPEAFRSAVILRDLEGLSYDEIAEVLECSVGTVKSRILRGRRALRELLEPLLGDRATHRSASHTHGAASDFAVSGIMSRPAYGRVGAHDAMISSRSRFSRQTPASEELP